MTVTPVQSTVEEVGGVCVCVCVCVCVHMCVCGGGDRVLTELPNFHPYPITTALQFPHSLSTQHLPTTSPPSPRHASNTTLPFRMAPEHFVHSSDTPAGRSVRRLQQPAAVGRGREGWKEEKADYGHMFGEYLITYGIIYTKQIIELCLPISMRKQHPLK